MLDRILGFFKEKMGGGSSEPGQAAPSGRSGQSDGADTQQAESAREELMANAPKALLMKLEADAGAKIPPHQTSDPGMQVNESKEAHMPAKEGNFQPELKRSKVARSGDGP